MVLCLPIFGLFIHLVTEGGMGVGRHFECIVHWLLPDLVSEVCPPFFPFFSTPGQNDWRSFCMCAILHYDNSVSEWSNLPATLSAVLKLLNSKVVLPLFRGEITSLSKMGLCQAEQVTNRLPWPSSVISVV